MLSNESLENIARFKHLSMQNAERDYLQDVLLFSIYSRAGRELVFKGGTCLFKAYNLDRFSEDLDFTFSRKGDIKGIIKNLPNDLLLLGIRAQIKEIKEHKNELNARMLINGPLFRGTKATQCFIPLNISMKEKVLLEPRQVRLNPLYAELPSFEVFAMHEREMLAEKVRAIISREKPRDVYDLWHLVKAKGIKPDFEAINKKLKLYSLSFSADLFRAAVNRKERLWESDLRGLMFREVPPFKSVSREIIGLLGQH
ncbi:MAG: nucleotidyl transferase AbiEii/AbiGii toxin family protein [Nanoarchaeota archaeon]|nr:nucleotidyl transferase AbiEii/AbiGii toxin family protein [Nanoarchaeota archaeon]